MTQEIFDNLCHIGCTYIDTENEKLALSVMKILGIQYDKDAKMFNCTSINDQRSIFNYISTKNKWNQYITSSKVTPLPLNAFDVECIEDLFKNPEYAESIIPMAPLFSSIGWILEHTLETWKIKFEGSATYDLWKISPDFYEKADWKHPYGESLDEDNLIAEVTNGGSMWDWKKGDFLDGITEKQIENINWKEYFFKEN